MAASLLTFIFFLLLQLLNNTFSLEIHFYNQSCPRAELIVNSVVRKHVLQDPSIPAGLLRLHFHDCLNGCDASILIDSTEDNIAEKEAPPNLTLRGFEVIDDIKASLEDECKGVVSCADILAMATRDSVALSGGAAYAIPTGRRDSTVSTIANVHIPSPSFPFSAALSVFQSIGLDLVDMTTLLGAHSVGFCHCGFFIDRLYDFEGTGLPDPAMDTGLLDTLRQQCPPHVVTLNNISKDPTVFMDQQTKTPFRLDGSFYHGVVDKRAVLQLDQELDFTDLTSKLALKYANNPKSFIKQFSKSMIKLGSTNVLTGEQGEIRQNCRRVNG
ncbi:peroxidase 57-like [Dioscorea cayenensis subsp. rotundata]|uniref:Peroxidase n=1 Tax=Dioscorea cayennensis subsp. rotundata TaxID=55577 RepID=A0AB40CIX1_DIOCR|nr:peroxidase 57-like [Dioscorea cayenensis subsp. rotundata]